VSKNDDAKKLASKDTVYDSKRYKLWDSSKFTIQLHRPAYYRLPKGACIMPHQWIRFIHIPATCATDSISIHKHIIRIKIRSNLIIVLKETTTTANEAPSLLPVSKFHFF